MVGPGRRRIADFIDELTFLKSRGGSIEVKIAEGSPPPPYEDGLVYQTARDAGDPANIRYCVTREVEFRKFAVEIMDDITVLYPSE